MLFAVRFFLHLASLHSAGAQVRVPHGMGVGGKTPNCKPFTCPKNQKPVSKSQHQLWAVGCKGEPKDIDKGYTKDIDKCCVERDICRQICGIPVKVCHDKMLKCADKAMKKCGDNGSCRLKIADVEVQNEAFFGDRSIDLSKAKNREEAICRDYVRGQEEACTCVPNTEWDSSVVANLKGFYKNYNPEKLDAQGNIPDIGEVWKKWKNKPHEMFLALALKYQDKAVERRTKKPSASASPPKKSAKDIKIEADEKKQRAKRKDDNDEGADEKGSDKKPPEPEAPQLDEDDKRFKEKLKQLETRKENAKIHNAPDQEAKIKEKILEMKEEENKRLQAKKEKAVLDEDFMEAKRIKQRQAEL